jgi:putative acetyltransferase
MGLAPVAVLPQYQRQGIGSLLISKGLDELKNMNVKAAFVLGDNRFYSRFGFVPSFSRFGIKSKFNVEDKNFMALELFDRSLDKISGNLEYCKAFDDL